MNITYTKRESNVGGLDEAQTFHQFGFNEIIFLKGSVILIWMSNSRPDLQKVIDLDDVVFMRIEE